MSLFTILAILAFLPLCLTVEKLRVRPTAITVAKVAMEQVLYLLGGILLISACTGVAFLAAVLLPYVLIVVGAVAVLAVAVAASVGTYHVVNFLAIAAGKAAVLLGRIIVEVPLRTMAAIGRPLHAMFTHIEDKCDDVVEAISIKRAMVAHRREQAKAEAEAKRVHQVRLDCGYFEIKAELKTVKAQLAAQATHTERNIILEDQSVVLDGIVQEQGDVIDNLSSLVRMFAHSDQSVKAVNLIGHYLDIRPVGGVKGRTKAVVIDEIRAKASTQQA